MRKITFTVLSGALALCVAASAARADARSYFRMPLPSAGSGQAAGSGGQAGGGVREEGTPLAFAAADAIPPGTSGAAVSGAYRASGGKAPYAMALAGVPGSVALGKVGGDAWVLTGTLPAAGAYPGGRIVLTDAAGTTVSYPLPITAFEAGAEPEGTFAFTSADDIASNYQRKFQTSYFSFENGTAPYAIAVENLPASATVVRDNAYVPYFQVYSVFEAATDGPDGTPGTPVSGGRVTVTDARGRTITHAFPAFSVMRDDAWEEIQVGDPGQPPSPLGVGQRWEGPAFSVTGNAPYSYAVDLANGSPNSYVESLGNNAFRIVVDPQASDAGLYPSPYLDVRVDGGRYGQRPHRIVPLAGYRVQGEPLAKVSDFPSTLPVDVSADATASALFKGGSGNFDVAFEGVPAGSPLAWEVTDAGGGNRGLVLSGTWNDAGSFPAVRVTLTDLGTQERIPFAPFAVEATARPLSECVGMPGGASTLKAIVGRYAHNDAAITFRGGVPPYSLTPAAPIPAGMGVTFDTGGVGSGPVRAIAVAMEPSETGQVSDADAVLRDGTGSSCTVKLNAKAAPVPVPDPDLVVDTVPDTRVTYDGTVYTSTASTATRLISALSAEELVRRRGRGFELCSFCLGYFLVPPAGKSIATSNPDRYYGMKQGVPLLQAIEYRAGSSEQPNMMRPLLTWSNGDAAQQPSDSGVYLDVDRLVLPFGAGVWTFRFAVEFEDGTAGMTRTFTVEVPGEGTN